MQGRRVVRPGACQRADEVVGRAAIARVERAAHRAGAGLDLADDLQPIRRGRLPAVQRAPRIARAVEVQLDQRQLAELRPAALLQPLRCLDRALRDQRAAPPAVMPVPPLPISVAASSNSAGAPCACSAGAARRPAPPGAPCTRGPRAQLALLAQARRRSPPPGAPCAAGCRGRRASCRRSGASRARPGTGRHRAPRLMRLADQPVDHGLGAGQPHRAVVADQQRLADEPEVAVEHRAPAARRVGGGRWPASAAATPKTDQSSESTAARAEQAARRPAAHQRGARRRAAAGAAARPGRRHRAAWSRRSRAVRRRRRTPAPRPAACRARHRASRSRTPGSIALA